MEREKVSMGYKKWLTDRRAALKDCSEVIETAKGIVEFQKRLDGASRMPAK